jgi:hypothetical protein
MNNATLVSVLAVVLSTALLSGCETEEKNLLAQAQACINDARPGNVGQCRQYLNNLSNEKSYLLRCSIDFIEQGFTAKAMGKAFQAIAQSGSSQTATFMGFMAFSSTAAADQTYANCSKSGEGSYIVIASIAQVSTLAASVSGQLANINRESGIDLTSGINTLIGDTTTHLTVGNAVRNAYSAACNTPANAGSPMCEKIVKAIDTGGTATTVGLNFLNSLL